MHVSTIIGEKGNAVYTVEPGQMISDTIDLLCNRRIGAVVVVEATHQVCGVISERDVIRALHQDGASILSRPVRDYMTADVVTCGLSDSVDHLMGLFTRRRIRHLPVIEGGRLAGLISIGDVVKFRMAEVESEANALKSYIANS